MEFSFFCFFFVIFLSFFCLFLSFFVSFFVTFCVFCHFFVIFLCVFCHFFAVFKCFSSISFLSFDFPLICLFFPLKFPILCASKNNFCFFNKKNVGIKEVCWNGQHFSPQNVFEQQLKRKKNCTLCSPASGGLIDCHCVTSGLEDWIVYRNLYGRCSVFYDCGRRDRRGRKHEEVA